MNLSAQSAVQINEMKFKNELINGKRKKRDASFAQIESKIQKVFAFHQRHKFLIRCREFNLHSIWKSKLLTYQIEKTDLK